MLEVNNLKYEIDNKTILNNVSVSFDYGKIYAITGHNGSGKSTLVKTIMGIINQTSGNIILNNKKIDNLKINERSKLGIGFTFQQPIKFKGLTVADLILTAKQDDNIVKLGCDYLSKVGLCAKDYLNRELDSNLSGGELKRIELAINLAEDKKINIFDEPEAGIDIWSFSGLTEIFKELKKQNKITIIVTHQQKILEIADQIIVLDNGNILKQGSPEQILPTLSSTVCKKLVLEDSNE